MYMLFRNRSVIDDIDDHLSGTRLTSECDNLNNGLPQRSAASNDISYSRPARSSQWSRYIHIFIYIYIYIIRNCFYFRLQQTLHNTLFTYTTKFGEDLLRTVETAGQTYTHTYIHTHTHTHTHKFPNL
jgi:hypothetical protein